MTLNNNHSLTHLYQRLVSAEKKYSDMETICLPTAVITLMVIIILNMNKVLKDILNCQGRYSLGHGRFICLEQLRTNKYRISSHRLLLTYELHKFYLPVERICFLNENSHDAKKIQNKGIIRLHVNSQKKMVNSSIGVIIV